jgi:hypothetical protein
MGSVKVALEHPLTVLLGEFQVEPLRVCPSSRNSEYADMDAVPKLDTMQHNPGM